MDNQFWQEYRAALIQRAKALETERRAVLRIISAIEAQEKELEIKALMVLEKEGMYNSYIAGVMKNG